MAFQFKPAIRENVNLMIGLIGASGSGKTFSAMRLARGICGDKPFVVIDTEAGRAKHYADQFRFDHGDLLPPFRPTAYTEAIMAAVDAGYKAIVVDSASHEHAGDGGLLDWQEQELSRMAGDDWKKREACKMAAWIKPKMAHKQMVQKLLQVRAHLILCFRAEEKVKMETRHDEKTGRDKTVIVPMGWQPICEKNLPYELTCSFLLTTDAPGIPKPLKLQEQHRAIFPDGKPIDEAAGTRLAAWAVGGVEKSKAVAESEMTKAQKTAIVKAAQQSFESMSTDEIVQVVEWYCGNNGGKTFQNGEDLKTNFRAIAEGYIAAVAKNAEAIG
jgi:hypothetical protein